MLFFTYKSLFESRGKYEANYLNPQLAIIKASSQITQNSKLKDTFKYLKSQAAKKSKKEPVLGELWGILNEKEFEYTGELVDFVIDTNTKNIFIKRLAICESNCYNVSCCNLIIYPRI